MKTTFRVAVVAALALTLTGCGSTSTDEAIPADLPRADRESIFLMVIRDEYPTDSAGVPDDAFLELADTTCGALDDGVPYLTLLGKVADSGLDPQFGGFLIGASVSAFCPEYEDELR